jgi:hypothetical protein
VGSYVLALCVLSNGELLSPGNTRAGSALSYYSAGGESAINGRAPANGTTMLGVVTQDTTSLGLSGTWRSLTRAGGSSSAGAYLSLFVRIA